MPFLLRDRLPLTALDRLSVPRPWYSPLIPFVRAMSRNAFHDDALPDLLFDVCTRVETRSSGYTKVLDTTEPVAPAAAWAIGGMSWSVMTEKAITEPERRDELSQSLLIVLKHPLPRRPTRSSCRNERECRPAAPACGALAGKRWRRHQRLPTMIIGHRR